MTESFSNLRTEFQRRQKLKHKIVVRAIIWDRKKEFVSQWPETIYPPDTKAPNVCWCVTSNDVYCNYGSFGDLHASDAWVSPLKAHFQITSQHHFNFHPTLKNKKNDFLVFDQTFYKYINTRLHFRFKPFLTTINDCTDDLIKSSCHRI